MKIELQNECGDPVHEDALPSNLTNREPQIVVWGRRIFLRSAQHDRDDLGSTLVYRETTSFWLPPSG